jgi:hypothetical protein
MGKLINAFRKYTSPEIPKTLQGMEDDIGDTGIEMLKSMAPQRAWIKPAIVLGILLLIAGAMTIVFTYAEPPTSADPLPTPTPIAAEVTTEVKSVLEEQFPAVLGIFNTIPYLLVIVMGGMMLMALMRILRT